MVCWPLRSELSPGVRLLSSGLAPCEGSATTLLVESGPWGLCEAHVPLSQPGCWAPGAWGGGLGRPWAQRCPALALEPLPALLAAMRPWALQFNSQRLRGTPHHVGLLQVERLGCLWFLLPGMDWLSTGAGIAGGARSPGPGACC